MKRILLSAVLLVGLAANAMQNVQCHIKWYWPNTVDTFQVYQGTKSGSYNQVYNVGSVHSYGLMLTPGKTYYFVIHPLSSDGVNSQEIKFTVPLVSPKYATTTQAY